MLLILDVYPLRRFGDGPQRWFGTAARRVWREKVPFILVSLVFMGVAVAAKGAAVFSTRQNGISARLAQAAYGTWFYLFKTVLPLDLVAAYPSPTKINWLASPFIACTVAMLAMSVGAVVTRRRWPGLLAVWVSYLVILAPNSGIIRTNENIAADRYSYIAMLGWVALLTACICRVALTPSRPRLGAMAIIALGPLSILGLIVMTWNQCRTWRDSGTLWAHAVAHGAGSSFVAHYNLGHDLYGRGDLEAAVAHYAQALRLNPDSVDVHNNLGVTLSRQGKYVEAAAHYAQALRLDPDSLDAHYNLGMVRSRQGQYVEAAAHYAQALRLKPGFASAHNNLGLDLARQGKFAEAEAHYTKALRLDPHRADTRANLAVALSRQGKLKGTATHHAAARQFRHDSN